TPVIPTKVRCLDRYHNWLLSLEEPLQCLVATPADSPFPGWMNIRELRWHRWGAAEGAWARGVVKDLPPRLLRATERSLSAPMSGPAISRAIALPPITVEMRASEMVSCGTAYFYSRLRVSSPLGRFGVPLPTCPDQFFAPR